MATFTVTATQGGSTTNGTEITLKVLTGAAGFGNSASASDPPLNVPGMTAAVTPAGTGSVIYGSYLSLSGTTPAFDAATTLLSNLSDASVRYPALRSTATTTAGTPVTLGCGGTANSISLVLQEILTSGVLAEDASAPAALTALALSVTTAAFTPPPGSLLVAMVAANGGAGVETMAVTDTSGLGLVWTEQVKQNATGLGYTGIWTARVPAPIPYSQPGGRTWRRKHNRRQILPGPPPPFTIVQAAAPVFAASQTTATVTLPQATGSQGPSTLVACFSNGTVNASNNSAVTGITLGGSADHWASVQAVVTVVTSNGAIWYDPNCASGQTSVVLSFTTGSGTQPYIEVAVYEVLGILAFDQGSNNLNGVAGTTWTSGVSPSLTQSPEIAFGLGPNLTAGSVATVTGVGPWATQTVSGVTNGATVTTVFGCQNGVQGSTSAFSGTMPSSTYTAIQATFYTANTGPPVIPRRGPVRARAAQAPVRGTVARLAGVFAQAGPAVRAPAGPVRAARTQPPAGGRAYGITRAPRPVAAVVSGPPVRALAAPVRAPLPPPARIGRAAGRSGSFAGLGPPPRAWTGPVRAVVPQAPRGGHAVGRAGAFTTAPTVTLLNDAEGGSPGITVTTGNSGGLSGNAFDSVNIGALAGLTFDNTHTAHGTLSLLSTTGSPAANSIATWNASLTSSSVLQAWFRVYVYLTAYSATQLRIVALRSGATNRAIVALDSTGHVALLNAAGTGVKFSTSVVPLNQWFRLEGYAIGDPSAGQIECKIFSTAEDNVTPDETVTSTAAQNTGGTFNRIDFGNPSSATSFSAWIDELGVSTAGYIGPFIGTATARTWDAPVRAMRLPQRGGNVSHNAGTFTLAAPQAGPPVYPLHGPVQARQPLARRGSVTAHPGMFAGAGPSVRALAGPVRAVIPAAIRGGRVATRAGSRSFTIFNTFESQASGTTITPGNSAGADGSTAFDSCPVGPNASLTYDNAFPAHGAQGLKVSTGVTSTTVPAEWTNAIGVPQVTLWFRTYLYINAPASPAFRFVQLRSGPATHAGSVLVNGTTLTIVFGAGFTTTGTFTTPIPLNKQVRVEGFVTGDPANGVVSASLYLNKDSTVADETRTSTGLNTVGLLTQAWFAQSNTAASAGPFWQDDVALSNIGPIGPLFSAGPVLYPLRGPVSAAFNRMGPPAGRVVFRAGTFTFTSPQAGPPITPLRGPVQAKRLPARGGSTASRTGVSGTAGPPVRVLVTPVRPRRPLPPAGHAAFRAGTLTAGIPQAGPPVYPLGHPVTARRLPIRGGSTSSRTGIFQAAGPPLKPLSGPVQLIQERHVPARGGFTLSRSGPVQGSGPAFRPLAVPVEARRLPVRGGSVTSHAGAFAGSGPALRPLSGPVRARRPLPPAGHAASRAGVLTTGAPQAGPPVYPLGHPVQARRLLARGGATSSRTGAYGGTGPAARILTAPVGARRPLPPAGRTMGRSGVFTAPAPGAAPAIPLHSPVQARRLPIRGGSVASRRGVYGGLGPPVIPLKQPVGLGRQQPPPPARGRSASQRGPFSGTGPPSIPLRRPVRSRWVPVFLPGRRRTVLLPPIATPPPALVAGTGTATVTDVNEGRASVSDPVTGTAAVTDGREGISSVTSPQSEVVYGYVYTDTYVWQPPLTEPASVTDTNEGNPKVT